MAAAHPEVSQHLALQRWPQRGDPAHSPATAWARGRPLDVSHASHGHARVPSHDEARVDPQTMTVLFRRGATLVTCYDLDDVSNDHGAAVVEATRIQYPELITDE
ncbi:hypothetical protein [Halobacterium sp. CBA1126]|uniref:hypothetical protein n=1 Tax=Halobacterium sp. CBA1126 TaxID=2668074 RepID=UPI0012F74277|nr:hypothetical protein [Halobacterium sp. CBA1126]MUV59950.1 hypothetical protein [Halobacterium sp. CBA1126]